MARPCKYPWGEWLKYGNILLVRGQDFNCQSYAMSIRFRQEAAKINRRASIKIRGDLLDVTIKRAARRKK